MKDAGYNYVTLDDCFAMRRSAAGQLFPSPELFPAGFAPLVKRAHASGFLFGVYTSAGNFTCHAAKDSCNGTCNVGSLGHYEQDAATLAQVSVQSAAATHCPFGSQTSPAPQVPQLPPWPSSPQVLPAQAAGGVTVLPVPSSTHVPSVVHVSPVAQMPQEMPASSIPHTRAPQLLVVPSPVPSPVPAAPPSPRAASPRGTAARCWAA